MSERIRGALHKALYKSTYTLLVYFTHSKDNSVQLITLLPLTIECAIGLIVEGALQMQLLLILLHTNQLIVIPHCWVACILRRFYRSLEDWE